MSLNFSRNLTSVPYNVSLIKQKVCTFLKFQRNWRAERRFSMFLKIFIEVIRLISLWKVIRLITLISYLVQLHMLWHHKQLINFLLGGGIKRNSFWTYGLQWKFFLNQFVVVLKNISSIEIEEFWNWQCNQLYVLQKFLCTSPYIPCDYPKRCRPNRAILLATPFLLVSVLARLCLDVLLRAKNFRIFDLALSKKNYLRRFQ